MELTIYAQGPATRAVVARRLREIADEIENGKDGSVGVDGVFLDAAGFEIGDWQFTEGDEEE